MTVLLVIEMVDDFNRAFHARPHLLPQKFWLYPDWSTLRKNMPGLDGLQPTPMAAESHEDHFDCCLQRLVDEAAENRAGSSQDTHRAASPVSSTSSHTFVRKANAAANTPSPPSPSARAGRSSRNRAIKRRQPQSDTSQDRACKRAQPMAKAKRATVPSDDTPSPKSSPRIFEDPSSPTRKLSRSQLPSQPMAQDGEHAPQRGMTEMPTSGGVGDESACVGSFGHQSRESGGREDVRAGLVQPAGAALGNGDGDGGDADDGGDTGHGGDAGHGAGAGDDGVHAARGVGGEGDSEADAKEQPEGAIVGLGLISSKVS
ncbi:hypothetical protein MAPG_10563 [Magnaporthiopsis poae ATCC 64411]|uniref:Uncharacterized protein n=1 Tax=Magnaporthiopsis poae (strain ATCC 64411 / 73-15) TaxID=644358 RepID=A0A0C4ECX4_MAGP6|nr:hypothetical protein MAPG_10563 [Magnaporthiopsis poae ATCC 64411]